MPDPFYPGSRGASGYFFAEADWDQLVASLRHRMYEFAPHNWSSKFTHPVFLEVSHVMA